MLQRTFDLILFNLIYLHDSTIPRQHISIYIPIVHGQMNTKHLQDKGNIRCKNKNSMKNKLNGAVIVKCVIAFLFRITLSLSIPLLSIYHSSFVYLLFSSCNSSIIYLRSFSFLLPLFILSYYTQFIFVLLSVYHSLLLSLLPSTFTLTLMSIMKNHKNCINA
jgi:hypothetical protein